MGRTINGKTLQKVLEELAVPLELMGVKGDQVYYPTYMIRDRFDEVCGLNWSFVMTSEQNLVSLDGESAFVGTGKIILSDDEGHVVSERSASKGATIKYLKPKKDKKDDKDKEEMAVQEPIEPVRPLNIGNDSASCTTQIFKKCAEAFGIGKDLAQRTTTVYPREEAIKKAAAWKSSNGGNTGNLPEFSVTLDSRFSSYAKIYKADAIAGDGKKIQLVIWKDDQKGLGAGFDAVVAGKKGQVVQFKGTETSFSGAPQLIVKQILKIA